MSSQIAGKSLLLANYGTKVDRAAAVLPATGNQTIFNVTGGRILLMGLVGEVTTAMSATVTNLKLTAVSGAITTDLCANALVTSLAVGNLFAPTAIGAAAQFGAAVSQNNELYVAPGLIRATTDATNTGAMRWSALYIPLDPGAVLAAA